MRPGDELKLQLPPFDAAGPFRETLELRRDKVIHRLTIAAVRGDNFIRWQVGVELPHLLQQAEVRRMPEAEFDALVAEGALSHPGPVTGSKLSRAYLAVVHLTRTVPGATEALRRWGTPAGKSAAMEEDVPQ